MLLHPLMLAWIGGAAVPLILHLLGRSRYRAVQWGAMMFLTGADGATHYAARIKQWVLLLLRMGVLGLLAVALARPVISARYARIPTGGLITGGSAAVVIILDDSAGMGYEKAGRSRLDEAREVALQILSALKRGDQAALVIAGTRDFQPLAPPSADLQSIAARVAELRPDVGSTDLPNDFVRAADLLEHAVPADHEIYLITDRRAISWRAVNDGFKQRWAARRSTGPPLRITVFPVGGDESGNVAIDGFILPDRAIYRDQPAELQVRVHNYGSIAVSALPVTIWSGARELGNTAVSVPARSSRVVSFPVRFGESGSRVFSAAVKSTGLTTDDRLDCAVDVLDPPAVLLITEKPASTQPVSQIQLAINHGRRGSDAAAMTTTNSAGLNSASLKKCSVVILDDIARLRADQIDLLRHFTSMGGGIALVPGDSVAGDLKDNPIYQGGVELLPELLQPPVAPVKTPRGETLSFDRQNPIFRFANARPDPFGRIQIGRYFPVANHDGKVLARFGSNEPFLIEFSTGRGRELLMTTPIDPAWNGLSQSSVVQPLMQSIVRYLARTEQVDRNLSLGQSILASVDEPVEDHSATVQLSSGGQREPAIVNRVNDRTEIRYAKISKPGIYRLRYRSNGREKTLNYVVSAGRGESDLTPLTEQQWRSLADRVGFERVDLQQSTVANAIDSRRGGREIWIDLIGGVLGLMLIEMIVSRWWSHRS